MRTLIALPEEILIEILSYLYPPWHLVIQRRDDPLIEKSFDHPKISINALPAIAPLLTCKGLQQIANKLLIDSFTGDINSYDDPGIARLPSQWSFLEQEVKRLCLPSNVNVLPNSLDFITSLPNLEVIELFQDLELAFMEQPFAPDTDFSKDECRQRHKDYAEAFLDLSVQSRRVRQGGSELYDEKVRALLDRMGLKIIHHDRHGFDLHPDLQYDVASLVPMTRTEEWQIVSSGWKILPATAEQSLDRLRNLSFQFYVTCQYS